MVQAFVAEGVQRGVELFLALDPAREIRPEADLDQPGALLDLQELFHRFGEPHRAGIQVGPELRDRDRPGRARRNAALERLGDAAALVLIEVFPAGRRLEALKGLGISRGPRRQGCLETLVVGVLNDPGELVDARKLAEERLAVERVVQPVGGVAQRFGQVRLRLEERPGCVQGGSGAIQVVQHWFGQGLLELRGPLDRLFEHRDDSR